jgi:hypothetical protein
VPYNLEGDLLEVCNCKVLCPCWIGEDPDNGTCDTIVGYRIAKGTIDGTDVSGLCLVLAAHVPGNILQGNWKVAAYVDEKASREQQDAILKVWTGQAGGPVADFAKLVGEVIAVERAPITFEVKGGQGTLKVGSVMEAEMSPYRGPGDEVTTLNNSVFSTIPGSPAYVAKASKYKRKTESVGLRDMDLEGRNAIQGTFRFVA